MALVGYGRVSTTDQHLDIQIEALKKVGCTEIFVEKVSGTSKKKRLKLEQCLTYLRKGDTLMITRVDRLARSVHDLQIIVKQLIDKKVELKAIEQPIDTSTAAGKAFFDMLCVFAEFETNLRRERQLEGIAKAKAEGKYKGREPTARRKSAEVLMKVDEGISKAEIASQLNIGIASVYRILAAENKLVKR